MSAYKSFCAAPGRVCLQEPVLHLGGGWGALLYFYFLFYWFVSKRFLLFRLLRFRSETPEQTEKQNETNQNKPKKCFLISRNKPKNNQNR
jgi:hypothetical protein